MKDLLAPEVEAGVGTKLKLPILVQNPDATPLSGKVELTLPEGGQALRGEGGFEAPANESKAIELVVSAPDSAKQDWHSVRIRASGAGKELGEIQVRVHVAPGSLPQ